MMDKFKNKYAFIWLIISFVIAFIQYTITLYFSFGKALALGLLFFIPVIIVLLIFLIGIKTVKKFPKMTKIITYIVNFILVIIFQFVFLTFA